MTSTDIALPTAHTVAPREPVDLIRFAEEAQSVAGLADALSRTSFVPAPFRGKPDEITAAILYGREIHMPPMTALRTIHVIEGKPSLEANAMRGLAQDSGVRFQIEEMNDTRVVMHAKAPGDAKWTTSTWTIDRARKMGLDGKSNWKKMPQAMLVARATSELVRLVAANVLLGMPYSTEELTDGAAVEPEPPKPAPEAKTVRRKPVQAIVDVPLPEPDPGPEPPVDIPTVEPVDPPQPERPYQRPDPNGPISENVRKALMAQFAGRTGIRERATRLAYVSSVMGRTVESVNDITDGEGRHLLDTMAETDLAAWAEAHQ